MSASDVVRDVLPGAARTAAAVLCALAMASAWGQSASSREQEQLRRLRQQVQQLQQEKAALQQSVQSAISQQAAQKARGDAFEVELRQSRSTLAERAKSVAGLKAELEAIREERKSLQAGNEALLAQQSAGARDLQTLRGELLRAQSLVSAHGTTLEVLNERHRAQAKGLQSCIASNLALQGIGQELLQRYADKGFFEVVGSQEPFLQLKRVALENLVQDYQDKLDQGAIKEPSGGALQLPPSGAADRGR